MTNPKVYRNLMDTEVVTDIQNSVLCWLATISSSGKPNVTPKEVFAAYGEDQFIIADIASPNSVRNIASNPSVCVSFVDVFRQHGFKIVGTATIVKNDTVTFNALSEPLTRIAGPAFKIHNIISIKVERIERIWAPSYARFPELDIDVRMQNTYNRYRVIPIK